jgi:hypothetical protein
MKRNEHPTPFRVLNLACKVSSPGMRSMLNVPNAVSNLYSVNRPEHEVLSGQVLFVESSPLFLHPLRKYIVLIFIMSVGTAGGLTLLVTQTLLSIDALIFLAFGIALFNAIFVPLLLFLAGTFREAQFWPIAIVRRNNAICAELVQRKHWCEIQSLSPQLTTSQIRWVSGRFRRSTSNWKLSDELKHKSYASWLKLRYKDRVRWVLLSLCESAEESEASIPSWAEAFELDLSTALTDEPGPDQVPFWYSPNSPKLF